MEVKFKVDSPFSRCHSIREEDNAIPGTRSLWWGKVRTLFAFSSKQTLVVSENGLMRPAEHHSWEVNFPACPVCPAWWVEREHSQIENPHRSTQLSESPRS